MMSAWCLAIWKTWKTWKSQGKRSFWKSQGKVREKREKQEKVRENWQVSQNIGSQNEIVCRYSAILDSAGGPPPLFGPGKSENSSGKVRE